MEQLPTQNEARPRALLLGLDLGEFDPDRSMDELAALAEARGFEPAACVIQRRAAPETGTVLGEGKLAEARMSCQNLAIDLAIFDGELTGSQLRNLADALEVEVLDRTLLILEIFKSRAQTSEGKLQTELALQRYRLPRLAGLGEALSRQGGGGAGGGGARRGAGESRLELDRRHVHGRIESLERRLKELEKRRGENRRARQKGGAPVISLVGYTNVGKSSLLNALCGADVLEADMLFATLDPTARRLILPSGLPVILVDTVGFVSRLPHKLVEAFKSTLEEAAYSDLIVKVADAADPEREARLEVTDEVLAGLGCAGIPQLTVYNKCDLAGPAGPEPGALYTSAKTGRGLPGLLAAMDAALAGRMRPVAMLLPYAQLGLAEPMRRAGSIRREDYRPEGVYFEGLARVEDLHLYQPYLV